MSNVPLPRPGPLGLIQYAGVDMHAHAAAVSAAKDAEIAQLRAELLKSLADNAALRADAIDRQNNVVAPLRERVRVLEAEVAGLREDAERYRWLRSPNTGPATIWELVSDECNPPYMTLKYGANLDTAIDAALAARKGEA